METRKDLRDRIQKEVSLLEKRITLDGVDVLPSGERDNEVTITLRYRILRTGVAGTQTVTMSLGGR